MFESIKDHTSVFNDIGLYDISNFIISFYCALKT